MKKPPADSSFKALVHESHQVLIGFQKLLALIGNFKQAMRSIFNFRNQAQKPFLHQIT